MSTATSATDRRGLFDRILGRATPRPSAPVVVAPILTRTPIPSEDGGMVTPVHLRPDGPVPAGPRTRHTWVTLLQRVRDVTKATAVLAVDDQGLVVGSTGDLPHGEVENIAAHVAMAFDLFERISSLGRKTESVCAQYVPDGTWLTAIRMRPPEGGRITIGIVGPYTLIREDRRKVRDAFERLFD